MLLIDRLDLNLKVTQAKLWYLFFFSFIYWLVFFCLGLGLNHWSCLWPQGLVDGQRLFLEKWLSWVGFKSPIWCFSGIANVPQITLDDGWGDRQRVFRELGSNLGGQWHSWEIFWEGLHLVDFEKVLYVWKFWYPRRHFQGLKSKYPKNFPFFLFIKIYLKTYIIYCFYLIILLKFFNQL